MQFYRVTRLQARYTKSVMFCGDAQWPWENSSMQLADVCRGSIPKKWQVWFSGKQNYEFKRFVMMELMILLQARKSSTNWRTFEE